MESKFRVFSRLSCDVFPFIHFYLLSEGDLSSLYLRLLAVTCFLVIIHNDANAMKLVIQKPIQIHRKFAAKRYAMLISN